MSVSYKLRSGVMLVLAVLLMPLTSAARWISVDPHADNYPSISPYAYSHNNPISRVDPDGQDDYLLTWAPRPGYQGHSAFASQNYDSKGNADGTVTVRHLWPELPQGKFGIAPADYRSEKISESALSQFEGGEDVGPDAIIKISGDKAQSDKAVTSLTTAQSNDTYNPLINSCATYTQTAVNAIGLDGGNGATAKVQIGGTPVYWGVGNVVTPVSVNNSVAGSKDKRVTVVQPIPPEKADPDITVMVK